MAAPARVAEPAARAWIHRRDELEARGERTLPRGAGDVDRAGLERLAQHFENAPVPFRQLVEEEHAVMGERYLSGTRIAAAADQRDAARSVMRRAERRRRPVRRVETPGERRDRRTRKRVVLAERRQQSGQTLREHRLACARRADQQHAVRAGRCDLERSLCRRLSTHVGEVERRAVCRRDPACGERRERRAAREVRAHGEQIRRRKHDEVANEGGFLRARRGQHEGAAITARTERHRQRASNASQSAGQRELAGELDVRERRRRQLRGRREDAERDRQIKASRFLAQVRRREIDRDLSRRKLELRIRERGTHAVARLLHLGVRQADEVEGRQAVGQMDLDRDERSVDSGEAPRQHDGDGHERRPAAPSDLRGSSLATCSTPRVPPDGRGRSIRAFRGDSSHAATRWCAYGYHLRTASLHRRTMITEPNARPTLSDSADAEVPGTRPAIPVPLTDRVRPYVPRIAQQHLVDNPGEQSWTSQGTAVFCDISGFTQLSEQLARKGREGAEEITDIVRACFEEVLAIAYRDDGGLLKFGGDALLLWFHGDGHVERACRAAVLMRGKLDEVGRIELRDASVTLQMSQGVHSGLFHFFIVGTSHVEFLPVGPAWSRLAAMEHEASGGEIVMSPDTARLLPPECLGVAKGDGFLLAQSPPGQSGKLTLREPPAVPPELLARCLSPSVRAHVLAGGGMPEHRPVTIAFIRFEGTDTLIDAHGAASAAHALHRVVSAVSAAADEHGVSLLGSDVDINGGKLILTGGAPRVTGDDEERMLLAVRKIASSDLPIPLRIGVNRGAVFAGDIGPDYRRTYTVMGDAVNLAARLMAKAQPGQVYATRDVLARSRSTFETIELDPFAVKGKAEPINAWSVGQAKSSRTRQVDDERLPVTGRNAVLGVIRKAFSSARGGEGKLVCVVGEAGLGKTRLLEALRDAAAGFRKLHAACEAYTATTPYALWRELLRESMGFGRDDADDVIVERLHAEVQAKTPDLVPMFPLIAIAFGLDVPPTPEVELLAEQNRRAKLHETVEAFLAAAMPERALIEIENAHQMDEASGDLLAHVATTLGARPWLIAVARRPGDAGFVPAEAPSVVRVDLKPLAASDALRLAQLATKDTPLPPHVLHVVATRSGGNPQFLRDLLRTAVASGGVADLPDSAEAAAMTQIDMLEPDVRGVVRRAAVFGLTFHPRMLSWLYDETEGPPPGEDMLAKLRDVFDEEPDGYLRFRHSLLRDSAYEGLPFKLRRKIHGAVAANLERELDVPEEAADILSLHYFEAGEYRPAWQYSVAAGKRAEAVYAYVEAAKMYARALDAGRQLNDLDHADIAPTHAALGDAWYQAGEFRKAADAYTGARAVSNGDTLTDARLLFKLSRVEAKLGQCEQALRWAEDARAALNGLDGPDAARQSARAGAWCAMVLQTEGRTSEALEWAERTIGEAEAAADAEALADAYFVKGWAYGEIPDEQAVDFMQRSLENYQRSGNLVMQAGVLSSLGVVCQWAGRWDEALSYYERGRQDAMKIGDTVGAALARVNIAEILCDRGEWAEAETMLLESLPLWRASQHHYYLGACLLFLGRVSLCRGRLDEAMSRLEEAKSSFVHVGAELEVPRVDARIAECRVAMGDSDGALALARGVLQRSSEANGVARVVSLLERVQAHALLKQGDLWGARDALEASLAAAKERGDHFEATLTQLSLIEVDRLEGVEPPIDIVDESRSLLATLKVRAVPPVPVPPQ